MTHCWQLENFIAEAGLLWKQKLHHRQLNAPGAYHGQGKKGSTILQVIVWHQIQSETFETKEPRKEIE
jgi:hypothetical protein